MCSKQTLCPISVHSISYFFRSNKTYSICFIFFEEEHKVRRMPYLCCSFVDYIKRFGCLNSSKMFYFANNRNPKYIKKDLYCKSFSTFCTSSRDNFSTIFCFHSCSKSVCSFSRCIMWLVCSFHSNLLYLFG